VKRIAIAALLISVLYTDVGLWACKHAAAQERYEDRFHGATPDDVWGKPEPHAIFIRPVCVSPAFYIYASPCSMVDLGYLDEYSRFHFTRRLTYSKRRAVIKHLGDSGLIQFWDD
jgi:hypothetical protein